MGIQEYGQYTLLYKPVSMAGASAAEKMARTIDNKRLINKAISLKKRAAKHIESCYDPIRKVYTIQQATQTLMPAPSSLFDELS